jgi:hypothetical protein
MAKRKRTETELEASLREQVGFLIKRGAGFDAGDDSEAKQLATPLRILVHDTERSHALLVQMHALDRLRFIDTSHPPVGSGQVRMDSGLAVIELATDGSARYTAPRGERPQRAPRRFGPWWNDTVLTDTHGNEFSRRRLVLALAHTDGGAHVNPEIDEAYDALSVSNSLGWTFHTGDGIATPAGSPVPANVRQIAWEMQTTLQGHFRNLLSGAYVPG